MKCFKSILYLFVTACITVTSCKPDVASSDQLSLIPGDAKVVFEIHGNEIFSKSGLNSPDDFQMLGLLKMGNTKAYNFVESLLKGSKEAGISAEKVLFYSSGIPDWAVIIPVSDRANLEKWLKEAGTPEPSNEGEFSYIADGFSLAWNDNLAIISAADNRNQIAERFNPKKDGLLAVNDDFKQYAEKNADIRVWLRYGFITDLYTNILFFAPSSFSGEDIADLSLLKEFENISIHSYINFENGKITGSGSLHPAEEVAKLKEKFPVFKSSFNTAILKDLPEQSYLAVNAFFDVKAYFSIMREYLEKIIENTQKLSDYYSEDRNDELSDFLNSSELKSVLDALGGDILLSIHGFNKGLITYPLASIVFTVNGESAFKDILNLIPKDAYREQNGYYAVSVSKTFIPVYFAYKDSRVFVSNDLEAVTGFVDGLKSKTFADNPIGKVMTDKMVLYFNLDFETYPKDIKMFLQNIMGQEFNIFTSIVGIYENMYFSSDADYNSEFVLQLKNKDVNALKQILKQVEQVYFTGILSH
jgi:hypothetical protein